MAQPVGLTAVVTQLGIGLGLFYGMVKFFDTVGDRLNDDTRLEIAVWLRGVKTSEMVQGWPDTFAKVFDRLFGRKHLSWRCFWRSCVASVITATVVYFALLGSSSRGMLQIFSIGFGTYVFGIPGLPVVIAWGVFTMFVNVVPDYVSLLKTRFFLKVIASSQSAFRRVSILLGDAILTTMIALVPVVAIGSVALSSFNRMLGEVTSLSSEDFTRAKQMARAEVQKNDKNNKSKVVMDAMIDLLDAKRSGDEKQQFRIFRETFLVPLVQGAMTIIAPAFFTSIWLWLYVGAGFLIKAAPRFDTGFKWLNRMFDIEKKPLQSIGLVAGAMIAVVYWGAVVAMRFV
jgi:hypothetical protein